LETLLFGFMYVRTDSWIAIFGTWIAIFEH
jgi:hypothetical protein